MIYKRTLFGAAMGLLVVSALALPAWMFITTTEEQRLKVRHDRTWTVRLKIKPCDVAIDRVWSMPYQDGRPEDLDMQPRAAGDILFQWWQRLPEEIPEHYRSVDLLTDMAQTIYLVRVNGHWPPGKDRPFAIFMWLSPIGIGLEPVGPAPLREDRSVPWSDADKKKFEAWVSSHRLMHKDVLKLRRPIPKGSFAHMIYEFDRSIEMPIIIGPRQCTTYEAAAGDFVLELEDAILEKKVE